MTDLDFKSSDAASPTGGELTTGAEVGFYRVAEASPHRLVLQISNVIAVILLAVGVVGIAADFWMYRHHHWLGRTSTVLYEGRRDARTYRSRESYQKMEKWFTGALAVVAIGFPLVGIAGVLMLGRSYSIDGGAGFVRRRRLFVLGSTINVNQINALRLSINNGSTTDAVAVRLIAADGSTLLELPGASAGSADFPNVLRLAAQTARMLDKPLTVEGTPQMFSDRERALLATLQAGT
jgi:hypothetical protein